MKRITIGRSENCTICYDANVISRNHALINIYPSGKYEIVNMGTNGTRVNGNRVANGQRYPLKRGDTVVFADQCHLDWDLVPDPMKPWRITGYVVAGAIVLGLLGFGAKWAVDKYSPSISSDETIEAPAPATQSDKSEENKESEDKEKQENPEKTQENEGSDEKASPWRLLGKDRQDKSDKDKTEDKSDKDKSDKNKSDKNKSGKDKSDKNKDNNKNKNDQKSNDKKAETEENTDFR